MRNKHKKQKDVMRRHIIEKIKCMRSDGIFDKIKNLFRRKEKPPEKLPPFEERDEDYGIDKDTPDEFRNKSLLRKLQIEIPSTHDTFANDLFVFRQSPKYWSLDADAFDKSPDTIYYSMLYYHPADLAAIIDKARNMAINDPNNEALTDYWWEEMPDKYGNYMNVNTWEHPIQVTWEKMDPYWKTWTLRRAYEDAMKPYGLEFKHQLPEVAELLNVDRAPTYEEYKASYKPTGLERKHPPKSYDEEEGINWSVDSRISNSKAKYNKKHIASDAGFFNKIRHFYATRGKY